MNFNDNNGQFTLSYELLALLRWMLDNESNALEKIVKKAMAAGLAKELKKIDHTTNDLLMHNEDQASIIEFCDMLEMILFEQINKRLKQSVQNNNLQSAIDHVDTTVCDDETLHYSLEKTTSLLETNPKENPKEVLYKEILRQWKPSVKNKNRVN